ncbi:hypothetical protein ACF0H5_003146 [Mactra antiquata]
MNTLDIIGICFLLTQFAVNIVSGQANCNSWSSWINDNHPNSANKNDQEIITQNFRDRFCPSPANTDKYQCKDNNGEPFDKNITTSAYVTTCGMNEVSCVLINTAFTGCPDLSIRFYCDCTSTRSPIATTKTTVGTTSTPSTTTAPSTPNTTLANKQFPVSNGRSVSGDNISNDSGYINIGDTHIQWWIIVLAISAIMFLFNILLTLCIFKHIKRKYQEKKMNEVKVHPLGAI